MTGRIHCLAVDREVRVVGQLIISLKFWKPRFKVKNCGRLKRSTRFGLEVLIDCHFNQLKYINQEAKD